MISPIQTHARLSKLDLKSAENSVGKRFAQVYCEARDGGLDSENASEYALNNTLLKFVAIPNDANYLNDLWSFTSNIINEKCGEEIDIKEIKELEIFFKEEGTIASNRDLYLPDFENN